MKLYHCRDRNLCLIKDEEKRLYTLTVYDRDSGRSVVWNSDNHKALTEFVDKLFK
jgi:hypothetical protein